MTNTPLDDRIREALIVAEQANRRASDASGPLPEAADQARKLVTAIDEIRHAAIATPHGRDPKFSTDVHNVARLLVRQAGALAAAGAHLAQAIKLGEGVEGKLRELLDTPPSDV